MQRFVYTPRVEAYIALESTAARSRAPLQIIDVTDDIISGSVTRRVDAMSEATLTLQNKHGRYTRPQSSISPLGEGGSLIQPMDRIHIRMSRVGQPMAVFSGYVDSSPHFQLYSGPVVIRASCALKRLQNTYFDPGLSSVMTLFQRLGFVYNASSGEITSSNGTQVLNLDQTGSMKKLIEGVLNEIGN